jgi:hypothetical protein
MKKPRAPNEASGALSSIKKPSLSEKSGLGSRRQKRPRSRQHFLNRLSDPQGQRSFRPSFSSSSLSPWTILTPRMTRVSDGNPRLRLLMISKGSLFVDVVVGPHETPLIPENSTNTCKNDTAQPERFTFALDSDSSPRDKELAPHRQSRTRTTTRSSTNTRHGRVFTIRCVDEGTPYSVLGTPYSAATDQ